MCWTPWTRIKYKSIKNKGWKSINQPFSKKFNKPIKTYAYKYQEFVE